MPVALLAGGILAGSGTAIAVGAGALAARQVIKNNSGGSSSTTAGQPGSVYRDPTTEGTNMLTAQEKTAPQQFADYAEYAPKYDAVDLNRLRTMMGAEEGTSVFDLNKQLTEQANLQTQQSNRAMREADLADVKDLGGQARDSARAMNPELYNSLNNISAAANAGITATGAETKYNQMAQQGYTPITSTNVTADQVNAPQLGAGQSINNQSLEAVGLGQGGPQAQAQAITGQNLNAVALGQGGPQAQAQMVGADQVNIPRDSMVSGFQNLKALLAGPSGIERTLTDQAQSGLNMGTQLAPEEIRAAQQAARGAAQSRGLGMSNSALAGEVLNTYQAGQNRLRERQAFAGQANQIMRSGMEQDRGYGLNVQGQNLALSAQGLQAQGMNQSANLQAQGMNQSAGLQAQGMNQQDLLARQSFDAANQQNAYNAMFGQNMQAQLANQSAGLQAQGMNQQDLLARQSYNATNQQNTNNAMFSQNMQAQLANQQNQLSRDTTNAQMGLSGQLANQDANMRSALANQQNSYQTQAANNAFLQQQMSDLGNSNAMQQQRAAQSFAQQQAAAQGWMNTYQDPYMAILGRQSSNVGTNAGLVSIGSNITSPNSSAIQGMFNPYNSYAQDLNSSNQSAAYNLAVGNKNASSATKSSVIGALGSVGGSLLGAWLCWVAREVYGAFDPRWLMFRHWLLTEAPWWFRMLYIRYGERVAEYISDKPYLKKAIRKWMDTRIATLSVKEISYAA